MKRSLKKEYTLALMAIALFSWPVARAQQQQFNANPETAISDALSAACRQDSPALPIP